MASGLIEREYSIVITNSSRKSLETMFEVRGEVSINVAYNADVLWVVTSRTPNVGRSA